MKNLARSIIVPATAGVFRTVFLYVGQGESTLLVIPDGTQCKYMLVDTNADTKNGGIDIARLLGDLLDKKLDVFVNTHPHSDHLRGIKRVYETVGIEEVWHSGHKPGKGDEDAYKELQYVIEQVGTNKVHQLKGSSQANKLDDQDYHLGTVAFNVLSPAEYVVDDIAGEKPEDRRRRIHEQCGVLRFCHGNPMECVMITGDADRPAWEKHITSYHADRLRCLVLSAPHHGSVTFFKTGEEEPYEEHIKAMKPKHLVISAPKRQESPYGHPDAEAVKLYEKHVSEGSMYHLGKNRESVIVDIFENGSPEIRFDDKYLAESYGLGSEDKDGGASNGFGKGIAIVVPRIDDKPMGQNALV